MASANLRGDQPGQLDHRPGRCWTVPATPEIQLALFHSYGTNPPLYPDWQAYFRKHQPPTLIVWGKNDKIFPAAGPTLTAET